MVRAAGRALGRVPRRGGAPPRGLAAGEGARPRDLGREPDRGRSGEDAGHPPPGAAPGGPREEAGRPQPRVREAIARAARGLARHDDRGGRRRAAPDGAPRLSGLRRTRARGARGARHPARRGRPPPRRRPAAPCAGARSRRDRRRCLESVRQRPPASRGPRTAELRAFPAVESAYDGRGDVRGKRVFLFAGIARPDSFLATVRALGGEIVGTQWFRDHHLYTTRELARLREVAAGALLVTTEKDLVRIEQPGEIVAVRIDLRIMGGEDVLDRALGEVL